MQIKYEKIENTKGEKAILTFKDGLTISTIIFGRVKEETRLNYKAILSYLTTQENNIQIIKVNETEKILMLSSEIYWKIYKKMASGKTFINNYCFYNEDEVYRFPEPAMYFNGTFSSYQGGRGVYGIYYDSKLIYIGYTYVGFESRFNSHRKCFASHTGSSGMYYRYDLDKIEFRELITEADIQEIFCTKNAIDKEIFQIIEYSLISVLQPIENKQGVTEPYRIDYKDLLKAKDVVSREEQIKNWLTYGTGAFRDTKEDEVFE